MKLSKKQEEEVLKVYDAWLNSYLNGDVETYSLYLDDDYRFIGSTDNEDFLDKNETTKFFAETADQLAGKSEVRNSIRTVESFDELVFITDLFDAYFLNGNEWAYYGKFRFTSALKNNMEGWRFIYQHFSTPDTKAQEGETWGTDQIAAENLQLREAIQRRTFELEQKNQELEVEAALERVRAKTMAMNKSEEMADLSLELVKQVQALGISTWFCAFNIYDEDQKGSLEWGSNGEGTFPKYKTPREGVFLRYYEAGQSGETLLINEIDENECPRHYEYLCSLPGVGEQLLKMKDSGIPFPTSQIDHVAFFKYGYILFVTFEPAPEAHEIFKRFAKVFEQTYTRFLDLQKAEKQAREAQIETALERLRSRTMGMQRSDELQDAAMVMFQQIEALGVAVFGCGFNIWEDDRKSATAWMAGKDRIQQPFKTSSAEDIFVHIYGAAQNGDSLFVAEQGGEALEAHYKYMTSIPVFKEIADTMAKEGLSVPSFQIMHCAYFSQGYLMFITFEQATEAHEIFKRFAKVFEQTYTRFLDLQKAETQAREAQIEAALERVRSRSMAMHKSTELLEVANVLFQQLRSLGGNLWGSGVIICKADSDNDEVWFANEKGVLPPIAVPHTEDPVHKKMYEGWKEKMDLFSETKEGEELKAHYEYMLSVPSVKPLFEDILASGLSYPEKQTWYAAYFKYGYLLTITLDPYPDEEVLIRFAKVFNQAYTRFLDLQKVEAQAREAQIETALERVRSRTMAMQQSEEMPEVANNLFLQVQDLGLPAWSAGYCIWEKDKNSAACSMSSEGVIQKSFSLPTIGEGYDLLTPIKNGEGFYVAELGGEELVEHYKFMNKLPVVGEILDGLLSAGIELPTFQIFHIVYFKHGYLMFITYEPVPEAHDIFKRFASVFEQTYTRFLDLQKVEEQAREAQIEAALEKVRSSSLAMQTATELGDVVNVIVEKLKDLGVVLDANGVVLCTYFQDSKDVLHWIASPDFSFVGSYLLPYFDHPIFNDTWKSKESGEAYFSKVFSVEEKNSFFEYAFEHSDYKHFPNDFKQWVFQNDKHILSFAWQKNSAILIPSHTGVVPSENDVAILKRFAKVFEQAYVRFMDLQKAEAQTRETQLELSLERIRAQVTSMSESSDLLDIVVTMRSEFVSLGHEAHYFWYMRWHPDTYEKAMTSGDGTKIGMIMSLPRHIHGDIKLIAEWEKSDEPTVVFEMDVETAVDYINKMITLGEFELVDPNAPTLDDIRHIGGLTFIMARTKHGEIGFSLPGEVPNPPKEDLDTLVRFAGVFDLAYSRFEDLKNAEFRNRETQIELALERSRNQSMLMQHSDELNKTSQVFHEQLDLLGIDSEFSYLWLPDEVKNEHLFWATWNESKNGSTKFKNKAVTYPLDKKEPSIAKCYLAWESGEVVHVNPVAPNEVEDYFATWEELLHGVDKFKPQLFPNGIYYVDTYMKYGCFGIMIKRLITEDEKNILRRFTIEFERAYTRFLDLQKAEAQAREAKIETALERVRSKTMAMQKGEDIKEIVVLLYKELIALGVTNFVTCGYVEINEKINRQYTWVTSPGGDSLGLFYLPLTGDAIFDERYAAWKQQQIIFHQKVTGEVRRKHLEFAITTFNSKEAEEMVLSQFPDPCVFYCFNFSHGYLHLVTASKLKNEEELLLARFTRVFEQTYARFLDLQKAAKQAKEAMKQASLDRVRGEIASMRTSEDLNRITPVIWHELQALEVPFIRCGVFIMDENRQVIQTYLSTPEGHSLSAFELDFDSQGMAAGAVKNWRKNKAYNEHWDKSQFISFMEGLIADGKVDTPEAFQGNLAPPENLYLNFVPFKQGMLYVGNISPLSDEKLEPAKTLAKAFSIAYARYEDFKNLEAAKNKIEFTLTELRAAQTQLIQSEKMASLGELTAGIAHEIQNPLNFVNNFSEVSSELVDEMSEDIEDGKMEDVKEITEDLKQNLAKINHHGQRASDIVKGMLAHSRTAEGVKEITDINTLADEYLRLAYHGLRAKDKSFNADFKTEFEEDIPKVNIIAQDVGRVLLNLINNAFYAVSSFAKATKDNDYKPTVTVVSRKNGNKIEISVRDNGAGIPAEIVDKIFQPFFTTKPTGEGTGLGLSMSYDIITKGHSGTLEVETEEDRGTTFVITIPLKD